jgi:hypothetical protein
VRVPEGNELVPEDHGDRVRSLETTHRLLDCLTYHIRISLLQLADGASCDGCGIRGGPELEAFVLEFAP